MLRDRGAEVATGRFGADMRLALVNDGPVTLLLEDREVGRVTSAARHFELGPIALAVVKRSTPADADLVAGGVAASQEVLVPA